MCLRAACGEGARSLGMPVSFIIMLYYTITYYTILYTIYYILYTIYYTILFIHI